MHRHRSLGRLVACWVLCLIVLGGFILAEPGHAQTPQLLGQGAKAAGMGDAFAAQADDASALHYNPAGMTQLRGLQFMAGSFYIGGTTNYTSPTGVTATGDRSGSVAWPPPSHLYVTANMKDLGVTALGDLTVGIGVNSPFGSLTRWPQTVPFKDSVVFNTLPLLDIKPTIAYKLNDKLSLGLGADIYTFSTLFGQGQVEIKSVSSMTGAQNEINGSGTGAGFNTSLLYTPFRNADGLPLANVAVIYRSQAVVPLHGQFISNGTALADTKTNLVLPQIISGAVALWPVRDQEREWKLELDVDQVGWKSFRNTTVNLSTPNALGTPAIPFNQNWSNSYTVKVGTEYKLMKLEQMPDWEVAFRAGYIHQQKQMPDQTFNPGIPASDSHIPSVGMGFLCKENGSFLGLAKCKDLGIGSVKPKAVGLDLSFQAAFYEDRTITTAASNPAINGTYKTMLYAGGVSLRVNF